MPDPLLIPDLVERALLSCFCDMLTAEGRPPCACYVFAGEGPPVGDRCQKNGDLNGQAWIRREGAEMLVSEEEPTFGGAFCGSGEWLMTFEIGVYRCISAIPDEEGNAPPVENYEADALLGNADWATLTQVLCCWPLNVQPDDDPFPPGAVIENASISSVGPSGGCAGTILTLVLRIPFFWEEPEEPEGQVWSDWVSGPIGGG